MNINGESINLNEGFEDLHTITYENILNNKGFHIQDTVESIEAVYELRNKKISPLEQEYHPLAKIFDMNKIIERFYCFGDSISFGQHITLHKTWTSKLSQKLDEEILDREIIFSNPSVNGNTTKMALDRLQFDVLNHKPNHVLIQFGLNDCNYWKDSFGLPRTEKNDFFKNICDIIKKVSLIKVSNIFLCTIHPTNKGIIKIGEKKIPYDKIQKRI